MARAPDFQIPRGRRPSGWAVTIAVAVHVGLVVLIGIDSVWAPRFRPNVNYIPLLADIPRVDMVYQETPEPEPPPPPPRPEPRPVAPPEEEAEPAPVLPGEVEPPGLPVPQADSGGAREAPPTGVGEAVGIPRLRPAYGEGILWVKPLPLAPRELAQRLTRSHFELVDSAVSAVVQAYLDSVVAAPTPYDNTPPSWTREIGGRTYGIDSRFIYLGALKIPSAILALLPIPTMSSVDIQYARRMTQVREDIEYAARRAQTMDDFKAAIREIRERRDREREIERNQRREPTDSTRIPPP